MPTHPPTPTRSDLLRRSPPHARSWRPPGWHQWHADTGQQPATSGNVHTHTSAPNPSDRSSSSNSGSTSPRDPYVSNNPRIFRDSYFRGSGLGGQFYGRSRVLKQVPGAPYV